MTWSGVEPGRRGRSRAEQPPRYLVPECRESIGVIHRDDDILVINKPAFLLSVPGRAPENSDCVTRRLKQDYPDLRLVHRLDLDTSGLMVLALHRRAQSNLSRAFQKRQVEKRYQAVVAGQVAEDSGEVTLPLIADWPNRPLQKVCFDTGKPALTHWRVLARYPDRDATRLALRPVTGRTHQLRLHCREIGHPILGCDLYAPSEILNRSDRLLLHAERLAFNHPCTGLWREFYSPAPF